MALHPFSEIHRANRRQDVARGLAQKSPEEVKAIFDRLDQGIARTKAITAGDWGLYVALGGDPAIARRAGWDASFWE